MAVDQHVIVLDAGGNRKAYPLVTISPQAAKTDGSKDYIQGARGFIVNRSPVALERYPLDLTDVSGLPGSLGHAGDDVRVWINGEPAYRTLQDGHVFVAVSLPPAAPVLLREDITDSSPSDGEALSLAQGLGRLRPEGLLAFDDELISYRGIDYRAGAVLDIGRGALGTTPAAHFSGEDRADLNGAIDDLDTAAALQNSRNGDLHAGGGLISIDDEDMYYAGRSGAALLSLTRGVNGTVAADHATGAEIRQPPYGYVCLMIFVVGVGFDLADPDSLDLAWTPSFVLPESTNRLWVYGSGGGDPRRPVFADVIRPNRPGAWTPSNELPASDLNFAPPLRLDDATLVAQWGPGDEEAGRPLTHRLRRPTPQGITKIAVDAQPRADSRLRVLGRDIEGREIELLDAQDIGEAALTAEDVLAQDALFAVSLNGVRASVAANSLANTFEALGIGGATEGRWQKIELENDTQFDALQLQMKKAASGSSFTGEVMLLNNLGGEDAPEQGRVVCWFNRWSKTNPETASVDNIPASILSHEEFETFEGIAWDGEKRLTMRLPAGTYWLRCLSNDGSLDSWHIRSSTIVQTQHNLMKGGLVEQPVTIQFPLIAKALWFRLIHPSGGPVQPEVALVDDGEPALFSRAELHCGTGFYPYVHHGGLESLYHANSVWENTTNGESLEIDQWMALGSQLELDFQEERATYIEGATRMRADGAVRSAQDLWPALEAPQNAPDGNEIEYRDPGMVETHINIKYRYGRV